MNPIGRLIAAIIGLAALPTAAWAQRPAPSEAIDEPGRNPYLESAQVTGPKSGLFSFVPSGRRLVIKNINCLFVAYTSREFSIIFLRASNSVVEQAFFMPPAVSGGGAFAYYALNSDTLAYVNSGAQAVTSFSPGSSDASGNCTLSGYYVRLP